MGDPKRNQSSDRIQYPDYMFSEILAPNDQYRQMSYPPQQNSELWTGYLSHFNNSDGQINLQGIGNPSAYNFTHPNQVFHDQGDIFSMHVHPGVPGNPDIGDIMYPQDFKYPGVNLYPNPSENGFLNRNGIYNSQIQNRPQENAILDNVLGNWTPNTTGTYSPFGNVSSSNFFECKKNHLIPDDLNHERTSEDLHFQFANRDIRKPRMVAEVKPMRPTYSDVLLKSVPPNGSTKPGKIDQKDIKTKKETKKNVKNEKSQKINGLNRSNTSTEIKDVPNEKNNYNKSYEKTKENSKSNQLNRKWVSLDDVSEPFTIIQDAKEKKNEENINKQTQKNSNIPRKQSVNNNNSTSKYSSEQTDTDSGSQMKNESYFSNNRMSVKKNNSKSSVKQQKGAYASASFEYQNPNNNNRRGPRGRKKENQLPFDVYRQKLVVYLKNWWKFCVSFILWLYTLVSDICSLSWQIWRDSMSYMWTWSVTHWAMFKETFAYIVRRVRLFTWIYEKFKKPKEKEEKHPFVRTGLQYNINMPQTGEEAMKRLLACKGKDPYSILGVTPACTDDDIKRYYKKQAVLVHPDKNKQPGAEEAFKILVHAFDMISEPERRAAYDRGVAESAQVEQAWTELTELLAQFQQKVEAAAKTIRCSYCGSGHKRTKIERPTYAARNCNMCKIFHAAREGDIWAEATCFGLLWNYYACMDGGVYDITDWASCQKNSLKQLKPDSHNVQYRIALGKSQSGSSCKQHSPTGRHSTSADDPTNLENLLNKFYGQSQDGGQNGRRRNNKKKFK